MDENLGVRRSVLLAGVWVVGVVIAVSLAFAAVARVSSGVAPNDVARLSKTEINDELTGATTPHARATTSSSSATTTTAKTGPTRTTSTSTTPSTRPLITPLTQGSVFTMPPPTATTVAPSTPVTTTTAAPPPPVSSHNTVTTSQGGTVYTRCSGPETIVYVAAVPRTGYQRTEDVEGPGGVRQTFINAHHRSSIEAECSNGVVHASVEEEDETE